ncbi:transcriptional regulator [Lentilactobacillus fungorum]|uniref:Transcriptional regulator n=1 Tax=Lentilactobacillus fungorum TaxID=2201250 RepID=A0ABQ3W118_9LACO|nr:LytTR family DNA-binding domain-containing protein [Lentilactobacillus fungorum]GHP14162.1 transcriptional regulator [Lentilactobacillus fungorum]
MEVQVKIINDLNPNTIVLGVRQHSEPLNKIIAYIESVQGATITGQIDSRNKIISLSDCLSFYSSQKKVYVKTFSGDEFKVNKRLYTLANSLPRDFIRISNTEIINLAYVNEFEVSPTGIIIIHFKNGTQTSSSRRYLRQVKERLS